MTQARPSRQEEAFRDHVVPEIEVMHRVALSLTRNRADAEDLVQDSLVRAYRAVERFDGRHPRAWLLTILRNTDINRNRRRRPELLRDPDLHLERLVATEPGDDTDPEQTALASVVDHRVTAALEDLPERFRFAVELVDLSGLTYQEAAEVMGVPVGTVMSRLHRARKRMRRHLERAGWGVGEVER